MPVRTTDILQKGMPESEFNKLQAIDNPRLHAWVSEMVELLKPASVFVCTDSPEDIRHIREASVTQREEIPLKMVGHTVHWDAYADQGRDKKNTRYLVKKGVDLGENLNSLDRDEGLSEIRDILDGIMKKRTMIVRFFSLGPTNSPFSISGVQVTDSFYVAHSEDLLYRPGYEQFKRIDDSTDFFKFVHSTGRTENQVCVDIDMRRVYIDLDDQCAYSVNTQYAGNTLGFKKLALRMAIVKSNSEDWLAEHMFLMGIRTKDKVTYFTGAFPSFCGKTSTAMIPDETIIGDDIAYLRKIGGKVHAVNVESGIFGIIKDVNEKDDPGIWKILNRPGEVIFSNVLVTDGVPYWQGDGREHPGKGRNHSGEWQAGKKDDGGKEIPLAHANARYTIKLSELDNLDPNADDPNGVPVGGIIYGGRDSDTSVPVQQAFDWAHGVITIGASLESETTAATLGKAGVRSFQPMSNMDFLCIPLGRYIQNHLNFVSDDIDSPPLIFGVNYFQKDEKGEYITGMHDKFVWVKWMALRANREIGAIKTPTGIIPGPSDLQKLFQEVLNKEYTEEEYIKQFTIRVPENLAKIERILDIYTNQVSDTPQIVFDLLNEQKSGLEKARSLFGDYISPLKFADK